MYYSCTLPVVRVLPTVYTRRVAGLAWLGASAQRLRDKTRRRPRIFTALTVSTNRRFSGDVALRCFGGPAADAYPRYTAIDGGKSFQKSYSVNALGPYVYVHVIDAWKVKTKHGPPPWALPPNRRFIQRLKTFYLSNGYSNRFRVHLRTSLFLMYIVLVSNFIGYQFQGENVVLSKIFLISPLK